MKCLFGDDTHTHKHKQDYDDRDPWDHDFFTEHEL